MMTVVQTSSPFFNSLPVAVNLFLQRALKGRTVESPASCKFWGARLQDAVRGSEHTGERAELVTE